MKYIQILVFTLIFISCETEKIIKLKGKIGDEAYGELTLKKNQDRITGEYENLLNGSKIQIEGTFFEGNLRLEEYAQKNKLTGFFEGKYQNDKYTGYWFSPDKKIKVPFIFDGNTSNSVKGKGESMSEIYAQWARNKNINDPELCTVEECRKNIEKSKKNTNDGHNACMLTIPEDINQKRVILGDINQDGIDDGIISVSYTECVSSDDIGIAMRNILMSHQTILLMSNNATFFVIDNVPNISKHLGQGFISKIENGIIVGTGKANSGDDDIPYWDLDLEWEVKFKLEKDELVYSTR